jgi:hypothetical protein
LPNVFQNGFGSIRKAAPPEEPEPEPFLEEPEPCQTGPYSPHNIAVFLDRVISYSLRLKILVAVDFSLQL